MKTIDTHSADLKEKMIDLFRENKDSIGSREPAFVTKYREEAINSFEKNGFPDRSIERWRNTDVGKFLPDNLEYPLEPEQRTADPEQILKCEVPDFQTHVISLLNGWYVYQDSPLITMDDGTLIGSLNAALKEYPELVEKYFNSYANSNLDGLVALNTALATDGFFIFVPDGVETEKTIQMVNIINKPRVFVQSRNLVVLGKNSRLTLVHCDDSHNLEPSFTNSVTEVHISEGAGLDHYKLQNMNNQSALMNKTWFHLEDTANLSTNAITLNGGMIRNEAMVQINGQGCTADIFGLYLMDDTQHVDNQVFVDHVKPNSYSNELFKGILDDQARAVFNGHVLVRKDSQKTNAYQNNKNLLLTDKAVVNTKPFLEIYADDVKCSHGATVGQLDEEAKFYIRSRGISPENTRLLLMYAFAAEVIKKISIDPLRDRIDDLVKKRLRGELAICDQCVLHCKNQEKKYTFDIDMSKI